MTIYVALLDEGVDCWRPVKAARLEEGVFRISEQEIPEQEVWEFGPRDVVRCDEYNFCNGPHVRAFAKLEDRP